MSYATIIGQRFGRLTLESICDHRINRRISGLFRCECGARRTYPVGRVRSGQRKHCGCGANRAPNLKHGMRGTPEYRAWAGMKNRCLDPGNRDYARWGGRGIRVYGPWVDSFEAFFADVGPRPVGTSLDRINTNGHYVPGNVRWATPRKQAENRRTSWVVEIAGIRYPSVEAAGRARGVSATTVVRWCDGGTDSRRGLSFGPREGCRRWRVYA